MKDVFNAITSAFFPTTPSSAGMPSAESVASLKKGKRILTTNEANETVIIEMPVIEPPSATFISPRWRWPLASNDTSERT